MSSFKSYGKVDEHDQMVLEAKRKTRKRIAIIGLSSIVLVGVVIAAVFGVVSNNNSQSATPHSQSVTNSVVKAVCDVTLYKDSCYNSLGSVVVNHDSDYGPEELFKLSIKVALTQVSKVVEYFKNEHNGVFKGLVSDGRRTKEALRNCRELLGLAVDHLNISLTSGENSSLLEVFEDLQTWLSAAGTNLLHLQAYMILEPNHTSPFLSF